MFVIARDAPATRCGDENPVQVFAPLTDSPRSSASRTSCVLGWVLIMACRNSPLSPSGRCSSISFNKPMRNASGMQTELLR